MAKVTRSCLICEHCNSHEGKKDDYQEVTVCPKCNGAFVDLYCIHKYRNDDWKPNKEIQREITKREVQDEIVGMADVIKSSLINNNLLLISLESETSAPKVFYKGEEVKYTRNIYFDWDTDKLDIGGLTYAIEHIERSQDKMGAPGYPTINRIERRVKGHASD